MSRETTNTDEELARRAQAGSSSALAELLVRHRPGLVRFLQGRVRRPQDSEDLAQEALLRACRYLDRHDADRPFGPWLLTIAANLAVSHWRALRPTTDIDHADVAAPESGFHQADIQERAQELWRLAREHLSPRQYEAMWLHYAREHSVKEVARDLGLTQIHVRVLLFRARGKLLKVAGEGMRGAP